ncbi:MAG: hypothetical protein PHF63_12490 [Herbinix sp.]|nr:hypothetical protein [Herbinix sp.]
MNNECMLNIIRDLINKYLNSFIDKNEMYLQLLNRISLLDVIEIEDELLNESYSAIYHMNEKYCDVTNDELMYYMDCINEKNTFSRFERDRIILSSSKII